MAPPPLVGDVDFSRFPCFMSVAITTPGCRIHRISPCFRPAFVGRDVPQRLCRASRIPRSPGLRRSACVRSSILVKGSLRERRIEMGLSNFTIQVCPWAATCREHWGRPHWRHRVFVDHHLQPVFSISLAWSMPPPVRSIRRGTGTMSLIGPLASRPQSGPGRCIRDESPRRRYHPRAAAKTVMGVCPLQFGWSLRCAVPV